jgi:HSP20 family protein
MKNQNSLSSFLETVVDNAFYIPMTESISPVRFDYGYDDNNYYIGDLPGYSENIDITIKNRIITISGQREVPLYDKITIINKERKSNKFSRSFKISDIVNEDQISSELKYGILTITIPKCKSTAKKIEINRK